MKNGQTLAETHGTVTFATDYLSRGYSKSNHNVSGQANIDFSLPQGFFTGATIASVDFGDKKFQDRARIEITPYLGWNFKLTEDWRMDFQYSRYFYSGNIFGRNSDYNEFYLLFHYRDLISANLSFSEDYYGQGKTAGNYEITGRYPITDSLEISAGTGYTQALSTLEYDYIYWNGGFTYFYKFASFDFRYYDAHETTPHIEKTLNSWQYDPETIKPSFVFSLSIGF